MATTLALVSPPTSATYGDSPPVTAKLSAGAGAPSVTGKLVTISLGGASQAGVTDSGGNVTVNVPVSSLPGTSYQLKASFSGDQDLLPSSVSGAGGFLVSKAPSNLVALSPLGATLTGTIGGKSLPIDGSVAFSLTSTRGNRTVFAITDYLGQAVLPPPGLPAGDWMVTAASFGGNATYNVTSLGLTTQTINIPKVNQTITFASLSKNFGDPDFPVAATATSLLPVSFIVQSGPCTITGTNVHITGAGPCKITASQAGNFDFNPAAPVSRDFAIASAISTTSLSAEPTSAVAGQFVTLTATVTTTPAAAGAPVGTTVTFKDGATPLGVPVVVSNGSASLSISSLSVNTHLLTAVYNGNANVGTSIGSVNIMVEKVGTTTSLFANPASSVPYGTTINLAATVTPGTATGAVSFLDGNATLATATLSGGTPPAPARASLATSTLGVGPHSLTASYAGDTNDAVSVSTPLTVVIKEAFTATGSMLQARTFQTATLLNDGRVLVAGGSSAGDDDHLANRTAEIFCPDPYTLPATPARNLAQWCPNGVGKFSPAGRGNTAKIGVGNLVTARSYHTGTLLPDGTVLLAGGFDSSGRPTATAEIYDTADPIADRFTAVANLPYAPIGHTATLITKGTKQLVLVVGGISASSLLYDPAAKTWTRSGSMTEVRSNHTASVIIGAKVLVAGGTDILGRALQTTRLYDIGSGTFSLGPTMLAPRELHTASAIANNKVLLAGGLAGTLTTSTVALNVLAEIFDPSNTGQPFTGASFVSGTGRYGHTASALLGASGPDGRVLVAGGAVNILCGKQLAASELFSSGTFATGAAMSAARVHHTATVLKDGRVLVAGGWGSIGSSCGPLNTAEIWTGPRSP